MYINIIQFYDISDKRMICRHFNPLYSLINRSQYAHNNFFIENNIIQKLNTVTETIPGSD